MNLQVEEVSRHHLLRSLEYWDGNAIGKAEAATLLKLGARFLKTRAQIKERAKTMLEEHGHPANHRLSFPKYGFLLPASAGDKLRRNDRSPVCHSRESGNPSEW